MFDLVLGLVTVGPLCRGDMVGGLAGVVVSLMGTRRCSPTQDVQGGDRVVFEVLVNKLHACFNADCQMSGICQRILSGPATVEDYGKKKFQNRLHDILF